MGKRTEMLLLLGLVAFFVLIVVLSRHEEIDATQSNPFTVQRSSYRTMPEGYKALYLTLQAEGFSVRRQTQAFNLLPLEGGLLIIPDPPYENHPQPGVDSGMQAVTFRREMALKEGDALTDWLSRGNHALVLTEYNANVVYGLLGSHRVIDPEERRREQDQTEDDWFATVADPTPGADLPIQHTLATPSVPSFLSDGAKKLEVYSGRRLKTDMPLTTEQVARIGGVVPLYRDDLGVVAAYSQVGQGGIVWCTSPWSFSNGGIDAGDNLAFVLALAKLKPGAPIIFDEYHQGYGVQMTVWQLLPKIAKLGAVQIGVALLLLFITLAWRFGPAQLPEEERFSRSRAEYLTAMASLLERARATHVVRERLSVLVRRELARRLGVSPHAPPERFQAANAAHAVVEPVLLERVLRHLTTMEHQKRPDPEALLRLAGEIQRMLHAK